MAQEQPTEPESYQGLALDWLGPALADWLGLALAPDSPESAPNSPYRVACQQISSRSSHARWLQPLRAHSSPRVNDRFRVPEELAQEKGDRLALGLQARQYSAAPEAWQGLVHGVVHAR